MGKEYIVNLEWNNILTLKKINLVCQETS